jgi:hypothetical protein
VNEQSPLFYGYDDEDDSWDPDVVPYDFSWCLDCQVDTLEIREYYMLRGDVWFKANPAGRGMLCVGCVERRLGRRLVPADFTDAPVNYDLADKSLRLLERWAWAA